MIRTGPVDYATLARYLAACDLGWLPLRDSGANRGRSPLKLNDFMVAGRAVVATDAGDLGDLIRRKAIGLAVLDEPEALAEAVLVLKRDAALRYTLAENGYHLHRTTFSLLHNGARFARHFGEMCGETHRGP